MTEFYAMEGGPKGPIYRQIWAQTGGAWTLLCGSLQSSTDFDVVTGLLRSVIHEPPGCRRWGERRTGTFVLPRVKIRTGKPSHMDPRVVLVGDHQLMRPGNG